jgi:hypothetical protein
VHECTNSNSNSAACSELVGCKSLLVRTISSSPASVSCQHSVRSNSARSLHCVTTRSNLTRGTQTQPQHGQSHFEKHWWGSTKTSRFFVIVLRCWECDVIHGWLNVLDSGMVGKDSGSGQSGALACDSWERQWFWAAWRLCATVGKDSGNGQSGACGRQLAPTQRQLAASSPKGRVRQGVWQPPQTVLQSIQHAHVLATAPPQKKNKKTKKPQPRRGKQQTSELRSEH